MSEKPHRSADATATYTFMEAIDRIAECQDQEELGILCQVLNEEKKKYPLFYCRVIYRAIEEKQRFLKQGWL